MQQQNHFLMYVIVFLVVFVPYLFLAFFLNKPEKRSIDFKLCNIPPLYRMTWALPKSIYLCLIGTIKPSLWNLLRKSSPPS